MYVVDSGNARIEKFDGAGNFLTSWGGGVVASGPDNIPLNEQQMITVHATGGTFTLTFEGQATTEIPFDASAATVQVALEALPSLPSGNVKVTEAERAPSNSGSWDVEFTGSLADTNVQQMTSDGTGLTGASPAAGIVTAVQGASSYEICNPAKGDICRSGIPGNGPGQLTAPRFIAIDNSNSASAGDVYIADPGNSSVSQFDPSGNLVTSWGTGGRLSSNGPTGLAVDASGNLFVYNDFGEMREFNPYGELITKFLPGFGVTAAGIAVDSADNLYVVRQTSVVEKLSSGGSPIGAVTGPGFTGPTEGLAFAQFINDLYVDDGGKAILHYDASCDPSVGECTPADSFGSGHLAGTKGLAVDPGSDTVYAADAAEGSVEVFDGTLAHAVTGASSEPTPTSATLNGHVDPA
ncbi:MAG TPA: NHL repeat-containing protein, partial [Solirubrobacteraceae bacterium]